MQVIRVPSWGFSYGDACYYGRRHSLHIGPFWFLWGQMTDAEIEAWEEAWHWREEFAYRHWSWSERATPGAGDDQGSE